MSETGAGSSGLKLPLILLLGFVVAIAGIVIWLTLSETGEPAAAPAKTADAPPIKLKPAPDKAREETPTTVTDTEIAKTLPAEAKATISSPKSNVAKNTGEAKEPPAPKVLEKRPVTPPQEPAPKTEPGTETAAKTPRKVEKPAPRERPVIPKPLRRIVPDGPLPPAPDPGLVENSAMGPLPKIGDDGRLPYHVYAKPFDVSDKRPRIGIVVTGLGLSDAATESAIQGLPGGVTLAFAPHSSKLEEWIRLARAAAHEVLLNVPMEPLSYPAFDPGPHTLLTSLNTQGNLDRLLWSLGRGSGYVGVMDFFGSRFTASRRHMEPVLSELKRRGLLYLDSGASRHTVTPDLSAKISLPAAVSSIILDERASRTNLDRKFSELERRAKSEGRAIGVASPYPVTLERIVDWTHQLQARGYTIAPISALTGSGNTQQAKK
jgi:polysaccharide deacetylase 2 family uncharacterized protein YibQ